MKTAVLFAAFCVSSYAQTAPAVFEVAAIKPSEPGVVASPTRQSTNNALPADRADAGLVHEARTVDQATAIENCLWVFRADVAGDNGAFTSYGSSGIVDPDGRVVAEAKPHVPDLLVAELSCILPASKVSNTAGAIRSP